MSTFESHTPISSASYPTDTFIGKDNDTVVYLYPASKNTLYKPGSLVAAYDDLKDRLLNDGPVVCGIPFEVEDFTDYADYAQAAFHPKQHLLTLTNIEATAEGDWLLTFKYISSIMETHSQLLNSSKLAIAGICVSEKPGDEIVEELTRINFFYPVIERRF